MYAIFSSCLDVLLYVRRFGLLVPSSVRSATWRSATNQRSALTTTRRMLKASANQNILTPDTSARFAAGSSRREVAWSAIYPLSMVWVTSRPSNVTFVPGCSSTSLVWRITWRECIKSKCGTIYPAIIMWCRVAHFRQVILVYVLVHAKTFSGSFRNGVSSINKHCARCNFIYMCV